MIWSHLIPGRVEPWLPTPVTVATCLWEMILDNVRLMGSGVAIHQPVIVSCIISSLID